MVAAEDVLEFLLLVHDVNETIFNQSLLALVCFRALHGKHHPLVHLLFHFTNSLKVDPIVALVVEGPGLSQFIFQELHDVWLEEL